ncbi:MAG: exosortase/archaeosortase family protein [Armatimonadetes bacterium]|nr:MAG: exosortase/archaeosortase family protein [Armatimonadota bacterium]
MSEQELKTIKSTEETPESATPAPDAEGEEMWVAPILGIQVERRALPWILLALVSCTVLGFSFLKDLPAIWFDEEGYYSHGLLVPFMSLAVLYMRREKLKKAKKEPAAIGIPILAVGLLLLLAGRLIDNLSIQAFAFILALIGATYYVFGKEVGKLALAPILFLIFMMPALGWIIDATTNPLQIVSTKIATKMLNIVGYETYINPIDPTFVDMNLYSFQVGGPCSGFKLSLALTAFTIFFIMISNLSWGKNLFLLAISIPLALFLNGLRIMMIGVIGEYGAAAPDAPLIRWIRSLDKTQSDVGMIFHDYSGYLVLFLCFIILHYIVKALERGVGNDEPS